MFDGNIGGCGYCNFECFTSCTAARYCCRRTPPRRHVPPLLLCVYCDAADPTGPSNHHRSASTCALSGGKNNSKSSHRRKSNIDRPNLPTTKATAALSSAATLHPVVRPPSAAKLESIDFNPNASGALTPVVIMHGLLGNSRNFQGWGSKLVKVRSGCSARS